MTFTPLLYMSEYPPSTIGGAPVIARQLLREYDMDRLHVLCDRQQFELGGELSRRTHLSCQHITVRNTDPFRLRPRRVFGPLADQLNSFRIPHIVTTAEKLIAEHSVGAIFTIPWRAEFAAAALEVSLRHDVPLYVFVTDDWQAMNPRFRPGRIVAAKYSVLLERARQLWLTSPAMVDQIEERFGVRGEFLFHFVNLEERLARSRARRPPDEGPLRVLYTGAINEMFIDTMRRFCGMLNRGCEIDGRRVAMDIYTGHCPPELLGPAVAHKGFISADAIPDVLAEAHVLVVLVSFTDEPHTRKLIETSLYTKTIDYLAAERPTLVVAPPYSGEAKYFGGVTTYVDSPEEEAMRSGLTSAVDGSAGQGSRIAEGVALVRRRHSREALDAVFLRHFRTA